MKQYEYNGYTIKTVSRNSVYGFGFGLLFEISKNGKILGYEDREKLAKQFVDWHLQYGQEEQA